MTRRERQHKSVFARKRRTKTKELRSSILERQYERRNKLKRKVQKNSIGEHKGKPTIVSGFLNFTKPSSDDEWGDEFHRWNR